MRQSHIFQKTVKEINKEEVSLNAQLLLKAGFVNQLMAGAYSFMPMGLRVLGKIENIIREEMDKMGASEVLMPALQPREIWDRTERWDKVDVLYKLKGAGDRDLALGPTHEEVVTPLAAGLVNSYKDLPLAAYQIQTKFRNEARAKSGLLRGREFRMKDMYSFHTDQADLERFYEKAIVAYNRIYERMGIGATTKVTFASGGMFSKYSHEFQTITDAGEDIIYLVPNSDLAINKEIIEDQEALADIIEGYTPGDEKNYEQVKAIEVGNIFQLSTRFSEACNGYYMDENGERHAMLMGCYGIGPSRVMGTIAECLSDDKGLVWPDEIAPYQVHLISLVDKEEDVAKCDDIYQKLQDAGIEVLYDDRLKTRAGVKFSESDLFGIPHRLTVGKKALAQDMVEYKHRQSDDAELMDLDAFITKITG